MTLQELIAEIEKTRILYLDLSMIAKTKKQSSDYHKKIKELETTLDIIKHYIK